MSNIIIKSDERKAQEAYVAKAYGVNPQNRQAMEHVECIAARTKEAVNYGKQMGGHKSW